MSPCTAGSLSQVYVDNTNRVITLEASNKEILRGRCKKIMKHVSVRADPPHPPEMNIFLWLYPSFSFFSSLRKERAWQPSDPRGSIDGKTAAGMVLLDFTSVGIFPSSSSSTRRVVVGRSLVSMPRTSGLKDVSRA